MIYIHDFQTQMFEKKFKDVTNGAEYICAGYGDNQGNAYLIGIHGSTTNGGYAGIKTVLLKNVEFIP